jgi:hypothetical protein
LFPIFLFFLSVTWPFSFILFPLYITTF